jgi:hypothetical protein
VASLSEARRISRDVLTSLNAAVIILYAKRADVETFGRLREMSVLVLAADNAPERHARLLQAGADEVVWVDSPLDEIVDAVGRLAGR